MTSVEGSPGIMPMFETFRAELDEHHDRRERIVKISRDITAVSKKMWVTVSFLHIKTIVITYFCSEFLGYNGKSALSFGLRALAH